MATSRSKKRGTSTKRTPAVQRERSIELKPIVVLIRTTLDRLKRIPQTPATKRTIERLEMCSAEVDGICSVPEPEGCGPNMAFPDPPQA